LLFLWSSLQYAYSYSYFVLLFASHLIYADISFVFPFNLSTFKCIYLFYLLFHFVFGPNIVCCLSILECHYLSSQKITIYLIDKKLLSIKYVQSFGCCSKFLFFMHIICSWLYFISEKCLIKFLILQIFLVTTFSLFVGWA
jgi:hypothetical protein